MDICKNEKNSLCTWTWYSFPDWNARETFGKLKLYQHNYLIDFSQAQTWFDPLFDSRTDTHHMENSPDILTKLEK